MQIELKYLSESLLGYENHLTSVEWFFTSFRYFNLSSKNMAHKMR